MPRIRYRSQLKRNVGGFTLLELMIVVAIVACLAAVAMVAYNRHLRRGKVIAAREFVSQIQTRQETYFQQFGWYCDASGGASFFPTLTAPEPQPKSWASAPTGFANLGVRASNGTTEIAVMVRASDPAANHALTGDAYAASLGIPAQPVSGMPHPWYYVIAHGDFDHSESTYPNGGCTTVLSTSGECTTLTATSARSTIIVHNEGK